MTLRHNPRMNLTVQQGASLAVVRQVMRIVICHSLNT